MSNKLLVIDLVGLTAGVLSQMPGLSSAFQNQNEITHLIPPLPAVTCTSQATLTTGSLPADHGIVSNGWFFRDTGEVRFWLRSDRLVGNEKIWETAKKRNPDIRVANLFWRFCTHSDCDYVVTERPTYWANGRKSPDVFTSPNSLRNELVTRLGEFPLFRFWGPATSVASSKWIADATEYVMRSCDPQLTLTYLPHLDYDLQKFGPNGETAKTAIHEVDQLVSGLIEQARGMGRQVAVLSEYGIVDVTKPVFLNRVMRQDGWVNVQTAQNGELLEAGQSRAFAACSHQVAHVYVRDSADIQDVRRLLESTDGVERVLGSEQLAQMGLNHPRSGELLAVAATDTWFAYPYWLDDQQAPDFARCVAIHDKPGHDPVEMFLGAGGKPRVARRLLQNKLGIRAPFDVVSLDAGLIKGSHGRIPDDPEQGPLLITEWQHQSDATIPMSDVKALILDRLIQA